MSNQLAAKMMAENTEKFLNEIDVLEQRNTQNLNFIKTVITGWKDGTLSADRVQILENGDMRIVPGEPSESANGKGGCERCPFSRAGRRRVARSK